LLHGAGCTGALSAAGCAGVSVTSGCGAACSAAPALAGSPHFGQNCMSGVKGVPHLEQKSAIIIPPKNKADFVSDFIFTKPFSFYLCGVSNESFVSLLSFL
jgi:hypothetical protein